MDHGRGREQGGVAGFTPLNAVTTLPIIEAGGNRAGGGRHAGAGRAGDLTGRGPAGHAHGHRRGDGTRAMNDCRSCWAAGRGEAYL